MSLLWKYAVQKYAEPDRDAPEYNVWKHESEHSTHALAPEFKAAGIKDSPCTARWCKDFDEDHHRNLERAEEKMFKGGAEPHTFDLSQPISGFEHHADPKQIDKYVKRTRNSAYGNFVWAFKANGQTHLQNGHHRYAAAKIRGDKTLDGRLVDLDKES